MKSLHIRNLDEEIIRGLKVRAEMHHRSVQKEVEVLLRDAARMIQPQESSFSPLNGLHLVKTQCRLSDGSRESIYGDDGR